MHLFALLQNINKNMLLKHGMKYTFRNIYIDYSCRSSDRVDQEAFCEMFSIKQI